MNQRLIQDISEFIFMKDEPEKSDVIFIPGTSQSAITEKAAALFCAGFAKYVIPTGAFSGKRGKFAAERSTIPGMPENMPQTLNTAGIS